MDVKNALSRNVVAFGLGKVDREVPIPVSKGIGVIVKRHLEGGTLEPGDGAGHVDHLEDRLEPSDQAGAADELQLAISLSVQSAEAVVADR